MKKTKKDKSLCECTSKVIEVIKQTYGELNEDNFMAFDMAGNIFSVLHYKYRKEGTLKWKKHFLVCNYCPFCGKKNKQYKELT